MPRKLKVFRMPIGFEDAYVAAPSRKAALAAWGAEHDQFARGVAEEVTDPALTKEPLARPGEVVRQSRGNLADQLKSLPRGAAVPKPVERARPKAGKPPPSRRKLDSADAALAEAQADFARQRETMERQLEDLTRRERSALDKLKERRDAARKAYKSALADWSEG